MKNTFALILFILLANVSLAQTNTYENLWKKVEQFELDGLPKSALAIVEDIAVIAEKDSNKPQLIKTWLFKSKFALMLEEDAQRNIINNFKTKIDKSEFPVKNILENILAQLYWQYFQQNRYKFYNRTKIEPKPDNHKENAEDFRTWDLQTLFNKIHLHYQNSLRNGLMLQLEELRHYDALLILQKDSKLYRPTLFDFLNHNALQFYKTPEHSITKPAYKFELENPDLLKDINSFVSIKLVSKDSTSSQLHALKIYQNLLKFHLKDQSPYALADVNIERLKFVNQHAVFQDKEALLLSRLTAERELVKSNEVSALYSFEIALIFNKQGQTYQPTAKGETNEKQRWKIKEALDICNATIKQFPKSKGAEQCAVLKQNILEQTLQITNEEFLPIQHNARLLVRYKNLGTLGFKVFKISQGQLKRFQKIHRKDEQLTFIKKLNTATAWQSNLRDEHDYQTHSTEIVLPKLDNGSYVILAGPKNLNDSNFAYSTIQVTNMALVEKSDDKHEIFQIIDRNNGNPIVGANVKLRYQENNDRSPRTIDFVTDAKGQFRINKSENNYRNVTIEVKYSKDIAYFGNYYINRYYKEQDTKVTYKSFLFTDRSIYRPGQTVYFKGIAMKSEHGKSEVLVNEPVYAVLYNTNDEELKELKFITNEFGSIHGEFILPNSGLNGNYYIEFDSNSGKVDMLSEAYFSVEEYKRPKFEAKFKPVTETYKVNDSVTLIGEALAFAGSNITSAKVVYRVSRKIQFPRWYYFYRPSFYSEPQEIAHGETLTNDLGEFNIIFKAIPDNSVNRENLPIFNYEVTADVTDVNGETRSVTTLVNVGYHALTANMSIDAKLDKTRKDHILSIDTKNLNGEFAPAKGSVKIYKLQAPNRVLRSRPWAAPDYHLFTEEAYRTLFPHEAYNDEHNPINWKKGALVWDKTFDTNESKEILLGNIKKWESGEYSIVLESKDKFGQTVKDEIKTSVFSHKDKTLADNQLFSISTDKDMYALDDDVLLTMASAARNLAVTLEVEKDQKILNTYVVILNNNKKTLTIPVKGEDLGGFVIHYSFAAFNSFQTGTVHITVPYPKTDLDIETITLRDKLQPGQDETWTFSIKGPQSDKFSAELLANMYDMSLDQFKPHVWRFNPINNPKYYSRFNRNGRKSFGTKGFRVYLDRLRAYYTQQQYDQLNWFGFYFGNNGGLVAKMIRGQVSGVQVVENDMVEEEAMLFSEGDVSNLDEVVVAGYGVKEEKDDYSQDAIDSTKPDFNNIQIRKNLNETAFFFPQLQTDKEGQVSFSFTTPEALTQWKLQLLAHTKDLKSTIKTLTTVTQKELMVIPNAPRFLREGDLITISSKIANLTKDTLSGQAVLQLFDALSGDAIDDKLDNLNNIKTFSTDSKGNTQVSWNVSIPDDIQAIQYKIIAKAGDYSDGEQNALPVLTNRMLVTETLPMWIRSNETRTFTLDKLKTNTSTTLKHHKLTLEMTSNPAWYAVQALPYIMEFPYECNEQIFSRYYANALATHIANSNPRIQEVFNQWKNSDALLSNLEKNEELKSILIQETPWLRDAQSETEQKKRIALLFDLNKMNNELQSSWLKLKNNQMNSGAWAWFKGGYENRYITQHIIAGFGHLKQLNAIKIESNKSYESMLKKAIQYLDSEFVKEYENIRKYDKDVDLNVDHLSYTQLHYLYMRSFFPEIKTSKKVQDITEYYQIQIQKYWLSRSLYAKGLMALVSSRMDDPLMAKKILKSLKEQSITNEELGMYWKANTTSWYWYQAPIETQALLIEAFSEIENDTETIDNLKIWLLKNKQTNRWKTTKATTEAVYALLLQGSDWLSVTDMVDVVLGGSNIEPSKLADVKVEAGTGYYKTSWSSSEIKPKMAEVKITKKGKGIAWGSLYWQYFEDLDKITPAETPLQLNKNLYLKKNTDFGEELLEITPKTNLKVGNLVRVRIELRSDRNMEFLHMKDMRASGLEPTNVLSQYKWQDGLGYYESTKDASTNFFFDYLPKGVYVFEYDLRVNNAGNMSNGITTIQSMYAPEFSSHSEGIRLLVN